MARVMTRLTNKPAWIDLASRDAGASRDFYSKLFGWQIEVNPDPQYGGYGRAKLEGRDVGGIGPAQDPNQQPAWSLYIGTDDIADLTRRVKSAGGAVVAEPFDVGDQGKMAVYRDPAGAFISAWQPTAMGGFQTTGPNAFGWAELNARGRDRALPFYTQVFGWTTKSSDMGPNQPPYIEFLLDGESIAGAWEMPQAIPAGTPSYWQVYFSVDDVDAAFRRAIELGAKEMFAPDDFPGGRFAIVADPEGASFGLLKTTPR